MIKSYGYGRLTKNPEIRVAGGTKVTNFSLASNEVYYKDGDKHEKTTYTDWQIWNGSGENFAKIVSKGDLVFVDGKFGVSEWTDVEGNKRSRPQFTALSWQLLSKVNTNKDVEPPIENAPTAEETPKRRGRPPKVEQPELDDEESQDIPF